MELGEAIGGTDNEIGQDIEDFNLCVELVRQKEPLANGATYVPSKKDCYAEFNAHSVDRHGIDIVCPSCQSCVFAGKGPF